MKVQKAKTIVRQYSEAVICAEEKLIDFKAAQDALAAEQPDPSRVGDLESELRVIETRRNIILGLLETESRPRTLIPALTLVLRDAEKALWKARADVTRLQKDLQEAQAKLKDLAIQEAAEAASMKQLIDELDKLNSDQKKATLQGLTPVEFAYRKVKEARRTAASTSDITVLPNGNVQVKL